MTNGWTGGQYSLFRAVFGVYLTIHLVHLMPWGAELFSRDGMLPDPRTSPLYPLFPNPLFLWDGPAVVTLLLAMGALASVALAIGARDRAAAVLVWWVWACLFTRNPLIANPGLPYVGWLLLLHACVPPGAYGSVAARGAVDPGSRWRLPDALFAAAWIVMAVGYSYSGWMKLDSVSWLDGSALARVLENPLARPTALRELMLGLPSWMLRLATWGALGLELLFAPLALVRALRPWLWLAMLGMHASLLALLDFADLTLGMVMLQLLTFDPAWIPRLREREPAMLFYDGACGLCHRTIRFLLSEDRGGVAFVFAPLDSEAFRAAVPAAHRSALPDSFVLRTPSGSLIIRSAAFIELGRRLGGAWRVLAEIAAWIPATLRDAVYDRVARVRRRLFAMPKDACPLAPPELRARFILDR
jgi:predicted DCC family thiol-disulfide oxidoreductase YuxK